MTTGALLAWIVTAGSLAALLAGLTRMWLRTRHPATWQEWEDADFSLERYQPMERLLAEDDLLFLKSLPGYRAEIGARWQRERRRIFRLYLREMKHDFLRLHAHARKLVADSGMDSSDLVSVLMKQQVTFLWATTSLEFRLLLQGAGIGKPDARALIEVIEAMRADLARRTAPAAV